MKNMGVLYLYLVSVLIIHKYYSYYKATFETQVYSASAILPYTYFLYILYIFLNMMPATSFHSVVVITSPLHGEGPQFDPEWKHSEDVSSIAENVKRFAFYITNMSFYFLFD